MFFALFLLLLLALLRMVSLSFGSNCALRSLSLCDCGLRDRFVVQLVEVLVKQNSLTHLALAHNSIKEEGAMAIAQLLKGSERIKTLELEANG